MPFDLTVNHRNGQPAKTEPLDRATLDLAKKRRETVTVVFELASDKPISVWDASACMNIPLGTAARDLGHQQLLPVKTLGNEYLGVRYRDRVTGAIESPPWTLVGSPVC